MEDLTGRQIGPYQITAALGEGGMAAVTSLADGRSSGGTLANGEIGIAPFHRLDALVSEQVRNDLGQIKADIIAGKIRTRP